MVTSSFDTCSKAPGALQRSSGEPSGSSLWSHVAEPLRWPALRRLTLQDACQRCACTPDRTRVALQRAAFRYSTPRRPSSFCASLWWWWWFTACALPADQRLPAFPWQLVS